MAVAVSERRVELATMSALGSSLRHAAAFLWSEAALTLAAAFALAAVLGWLLAEMLVAMLQHVFDPPPDHLAVPWLFLGGLAGATLAGGVLAAALVTLRIRKLPLGAILREQ
jgi:putative ABC transport system permease protein